MALRIDRPPSALFIDKDLDRGLFPLPVHPVPTLLLGDFNGYVKDTSNTLSPSFFSTLPSLLFPAHFLKPFIPVVTCNPHYIGCKHLDFLITASSTFQSHSDSPLHLYFPTEAPAL